jgi:hypothetical protein
MPTLQFSGADPLQTHAATVAVQPKNRLRVVHSVKAETFCFQAVSGERQPAIHSQEYNCLVAE